MATASTAFLQYDSDIITNYVPNLKDPTGAPQKVQSYTINLQCFNPSSVPLPSASVLVQSSMPVVASLNGKTVALTTNPTRYAFDVTGEIGIIVPATGLNSPSYTFSYFKDQNGTSIAIPMVTIAPARKTLKQFESITTGAQLKTVPGRAGTTLYTNKAPPSDADLNAAAKTFQDLSTASKNMPVTSSSVQTRLDAIANQPLPNDGWPSSAIKLPDDALTNPAPALAPIVQLEANKLAIESLQRSISVLQKQSRGPFGIGFKGALAVQQAALQQLLVQQAALQQSLANSAKASSSTPANTEAGGTVQAMSFDIGGAIKSGINKGVDVVKGGVKSGVDGAKDVGNQAGNVIKGGVETGLDELKKVSSQLGGTLQKTADGVEHVVKKTTEAAGWVLNQAKTEWNYVVEIAGQAWNFIIAGMNDIGQAFEKVWEKIKLGWAELEMWIGFLFDWQGIIATQKVVQSYISAPLEFLATEARGSNQILKQALRTVSGQSNAPSKLASNNSKASSAVDQSAPQGQPGLSVPDKWFSHQVKHGGITDIKEADTSSGPDSADRGSLNDIIDRVGPSLNNLGSNIATKFGSSFDFSISQFVNEIGDTLLREVTSAFDSLTDNLANSIGDFVDILNKAGNAKIKVPIISWIYEQITGQDLTLFSFISLCIAIPTSFFHRLYKGGKSLQGRILTAVDLQQGSTTQQLNVSASMTTTQKLEVSASQVTTTDPTKVPVSLQEPPPTGDSSDFTASFVMMGVVATKTALTSIASAKRQLYGSSRSTLMTVLSALSKLAIASSMITNLVRNPKLPRQDLRYALAVTTAFGGVACTAIVLSRRGGEFGKQTLYGAKATEIVMGLVNFGISSAISDAELNSTAAKWPGRDTEQAATQIVLNIFTLGSEVTGAVSSILWDDVRDPSRKKAATGMDIATISFGFGNMLALGFKAWFAKKNGTDFVLNLF